MWCYVTVVFICFSLLTNYLEHYFVCLSSVYLVWLGVFADLYQFLIGLSVLFSFGLSLYIFFSLYIVHRSLLSDVFSKYVLPVWLVFCSLNGIFHRGSILHFNEVNTSIFFFMGWLLVSYLKTHQPPQGHVDCSSVIFLVLPLKLYVCFVHLRVF